MRWKKDLKLLTSSSIRNLLLLPLYSNSAASVQQQCCLCTATVLPLHSNSVASVQQQCCLCTATVLHLHSNSVATVQQQCGRLLLRHCRLTVYCYVCRSNNKFAVHCHICRSNTTDLPYTATSVGVTQQICRTLPHLSE